MATIAEILSIKFPTREWRIDEDLYSTLVFMDAGAPMTEAEIRAFSAEVDGMLAVRATERRQAALIYDKADALVTALDIIVKNLQDIETKLKPASLTSAIDATQISRLAALANRIAAIKSS